MDNKFAERLHDLRVEKNLSQQQLSKELGVGRVIIGYWERGLNEPSLSKLIAIAKYFGVTIDYLAGLQD